MNHQILCIESSMAESAKPEVIFQGIRCELQNMPALELLIGSYQAMYKATD
jgi:hypothetical protein